MNKKRYKEYDEESDLFWPSEKENKITHKFYRDLSSLTKNKKSKNKKLNLFALFLSLIKWQRKLKLIFFNE